MENDLQKSGVTFTKEELAAKVRVPAIVEQDLKRIISERLEQCGMYFRCFSRIKTPDSMARKFEMKDYSEERKLQDLVGVRINLYFDDDVPICQKIIENTFDVIEWSTSKRGDDEFKPAKLNGVFRMPEYLKAQISPQTFDMCIDDTFEVQIKTMFFEGWHEVEHDMRYKGEELWSNFPSFSRYFNSILATLELCDKSMVTLFEDLGHALYKSGRWSDMIKAHFRLKLGADQLYPEVEQILNEDRNDVNNLAKRIFRTPREDLIQALLASPRRIPINVNTIIALLNDRSFHNEELTQVFRVRDVYNDGREDAEIETRHYEFRPLRSYTSFQMRTEVTGSRMKCDGSPDEREIFLEASRQVYRWVLSKYSSIFTLPEEVAPVRLDVIGYEVNIKYDPGKQVMRMHERHIDPDFGGRTWYSEVQIFRKDSGQIWMDAASGYAEPEKDNVVPAENSARFFSYPGFYKNVVDNVGIFNALQLSSRRRILKDEMAEEIAAAVRCRARLFPIVLIISKEAPDGMMDEAWLSSFRVSDFTRTVWRYAHVLTCYEKTGRQILELLGDVRAKSEVQVPRFYVFWPDGSMDDYGPDDVANCSFGRHLEARGDSRTYDIVYGGQAFYHRIVTDLRDYNISGTIWEGFQTETMTDIPD